MSKTNENTELLREINRKLAAIESLLQRLPEIQAAIFLQMQEEARSADMQGVSCKTLWITPPPNSR